MAPKNQRWWLTEDHVELDIEASADALYAMVSDLPRIGAWSPECESVDGRATSRRREGTTFMGTPRWDPGGASATRATAECWSPIRGEFAFVTDEGGESTVWRYGSSPGRRRHQGDRGLRGAVIPTWLASSTCPNRHDLLKGMRTPSSA